MVAAQPQSQKAANAMSLPSTLVGVSSLRTHYQNKIRRKLDENGENMWTHSLRRFFSRSNASV